MNKKKTFFIVIGLVLVFLCIVFVCVMISIVGISQFDGTLPERENVGVESEFSYGAVSIIIHEISSSEYYSDYVCLSGNEVPYFKISVSCSAEATANCSYQMWVAVSHQKGMWGSTYNKDDDYPWNPFTVNLAPGESKNFSGSAGVCKNPDNQPTSLSIRMKDLAGIEPEKDFYCPFEIKVITPEHLITPEPEATTVSNPDQ